MLTIASVTPVVGTTIPINVLYQSGYIEVINDSPYALKATFPSGTVTLVAGYIYAFPISPGGMFVNLLPTGYLNQSSNTVNTITVNAFQEGEGFNPNTYPVTIVRSAPLPITSATTTFETLTNGIVNFTMTLPTPGAGQHAYLTGFLLTADRATFIQSVNVQIFNLGSVGGSQLTYNLVQSVQTGLYFAQTFTPAIQDANPGAPTVNQPIQFNVNNLNLNLTNSQANLTAYGYIQ